MDELKAQFYIIGSGRPSRTPLEQDDTPCTDDSSSREIVVTVTDLTSVSCQRFVPHQGFFGVAHLGLQNERMLEIFGLHPRASFSRFARRYVVVSAR